MKQEQFVPELRFGEFIEQWHKKSISSIGAVITGSTPPTSNRAFYNGNYQFISPADLGLSRYVLVSKSTVTELGFKKGRKVRKGAVLFVCIGSTIGKVGQTVTHVITNQQINAVEAKSGNSDDFIFSLLELKSNYIKSLAAVQAVPMISKGEFSSLKFHLPSLPEQQKIADFLTSVDGKIQALTRKVDKLKEYKKGVMQKILPPYKAKSSSSQRFSRFNDWKEYSLKELIVTRSEKSNVDLPKYSLTLEKGVTPKEARYEREFLVSDVSDAYKVMKEGDFALNPMNLRFGAIAKHKEKFDVLVSKYYDIFYCNEKLNPVYAEAFFQSYNMIQYYNMMSTGSLIEKRRVHYSDFLDFKFLFPSIEEQTKIANFLSSIDQKISAAEDQLDKMKEWKKGLLQKMFV